MEVSLPVEIVRVSIADHESLDHPRGVAVRFADLDDSSRACSRPSSPASPVATERLAGSTIARALASARRRPWSGESASTSSHGTQRISCISARSGADGRALGRRHQVAQVEVLVRGLAAARGDVVHVHVERARRPRVEGEAEDAALLERLAQRHLLSRRLAGIAVASRLQPAVELAVVEEEHARAVGRDA